MNATKKDTWVTKLFLNEYKRNKLEKEIEEEIKVKQAKYDFAYQQQIEKLLPNKKHKQQLQQQQYEYWDNLSSIKIQEQLPTSQIPFQTQTQIETQIEEQSELLSLNKKEIINENEIDKENINPNKEKEQNNKEIIDKTKENEKEKEKEKEKVEEELDENKAIVQRKKTNNNY